MEWTDLSWIIFLVSAWIGFMFGSFYSRRLAKKEISRTVKTLEEVKDMVCKAKQKAEAVLQAFEQKSRQRGIKADE